MPKRSGPSAGSISASVMRRLLPAAAMSLLLSSGASRGDPVLQNLPDNGFFAPFNSANATVVKYGDSGWLGGPGALPIALQRIDMDLVGFDSPTSGTTDVTVTVNNGDPSGLVFGNGAELFRTTITGVTLPATAPGESVGFTLSVPLTGVSTTGGFNNVGWSVSLANYNYAGKFGFQVSKFSSFTTGFPTNNASFFNGSAWSLFSFGPDQETQSANFVVSIVATPEPITFSVPGGVLRQGSFGRPVVNSAASVTKTGAGTLQFDALNRYLGPTLIAEGSLALAYDQAGTVLGAIPNSPLIQVAPGATFDVTAPTAFTELQAFFLDAGQTLGGSGTVDGSVFFGTGSTLAPGMSPGTLTVTGNATLGAGSNYNWQVYNAAGTAGGTSGWDLLSVGGVLDISASTTAPFNINLWSLSGVGPDVDGNAINWSATTSGTWRIATAAGGITNFSPDRFAINVAPTNGTGGFSNAFPGGAFSLAQSGNDLNLVYTAGTPTVITISVASGTQTQGDAGFPLLTGTTPVQKTGAGTAVFNAANTLTGPTTVAQGTLQLATANALSSSPVTVAAGAKLAVGPQVAAVVPALVNNGLVDVGLGSLTITAGQGPATLVAQIVAGRNDGTWTGTSGITSSAAAAQSERAVGWLDNGDGSFTVGYAAAGDWNVNGVVDFDDVVQFVSAGLFDTGLPATWAQGDYDYNGVVDFDDVLAQSAAGLFDAGPYNAPPGGMAPLAGGFAAVPEPATWVLVAVGAGCAAGGRRRARGRRI